jgi:septal ring factor EnvC (AmiA/AmiB activator)
MLLAETVTDPHVLTQAIGAAIGAAITAGAMVSLRFQQQRRDLNNLGDKIRLLERLVNSVSDELERMRRVLFDLNDELERTKRAQGDQAASLSRVADTLRSIANPKPGGL